MKKSILVIKTPEKCMNCPCLNNLSDWLSCGANTGKLLNNDNVFVHKPEWCSLKPLPEKSTTGKSDYYQWGDWEDGWNACIEEILEED